MSFWEFIVLSHLPESGLKYLHSLRSLKSEHARLEVDIVFLLFGGDVHHSRRFLKALKEGGVFGENEELVRQVVTIIDEICPGLRYLMMNYRVDLDEVPSFFILVIDE